MRIEQHTAQLTLPLLLLFLLSVLTGPVVQAAELNVAAANSTCVALKRISTIYEQQSGIAVNHICKSSGRLAKGLMGGSISADLYLSANKGWMDKVVKAETVRTSTVREMWGNSLVVVLPKGDPLKLQRWEELAQDKVKVIMIGDPGTAPFGRYAKQALEATGLWQAVKEKIVTKKHITMLAEAVGGAEHGTAGVLFSTNVSDAMQVVYQVDHGWHEPIRYYAAVISKAQNPAAAESYLSFLQSDAVRKILKEEGFAVSNN